jgi:GMP synthase-like glutamine amidotransferase
MSSLDVSNRPIKVLILQCRELSDPMVDHEIECIKKKFRNTPTQVTIHNVVSKPPTEGLLDIDALIIGGSGAYSVHYEECQEWVKPTCSFIEKAIKKNLPGFGICFGHQLLGQVLGSTVVTSSDHTEIGTVELNLTSEGASDRVFGHLPKRFTAQTGHSDHVQTIPHGTVLMAQGDLLQTQAFKIEGTKFYSTQFHPDMTGAQARERYMAYHQKLQAVTPKATPEEAKRFELNRDDACALLGYFIDDVAAGSTAA